MSESLSNKQIVKFIIIGALVYTILKIIPSQQINNRDLILVLGIILIGFYIFECLNSNKEKFADTIEKTDDVLIQEPTKTEKNNSDSSKVETTNENPSNSTSCGFAVQSVKIQLEKEINDLKEELQYKINLTNSDKIANKYLESLFIDLNEKGLVSPNEIDNIKIKLNTKLLSIDEVIGSLELLKKEGKGNKPKTNTSQNKDDKEYNELPSDFMEPIGSKIANEWANEYSILSTDKWKVPTVRPPVCINTTPCKVCPNESPNYMGLLNWDNSRKVSENKINKDWANNQVSA